jgi:hypothetical protein
MKNYTYHSEIKNILTQFVSVFDDIIVKRFDSYGEERDQIKVRYIYSPKQRVLHNLVNKAEHITVPAVSISIKSITRNSDRVFNKNFGNYINNQISVNYIKQPVPIDINVSMSIITKYQQDMEQILSNFIPYSDPYIVLSWKVPQELSSVIPQELRSHVIWDESISLNYPENLSDSDPYRIIADTGFTIQGWLFKASEPEPKPIYIINTNFYTLSSNILEEYDLI